METGALLAYPGLEVSHMMTPEQMDATLKNVPPGSLLFLSYKAGRPPCDKAILEAHPTTVTEGIPRRYAIGHLCDVFTTKKGERCVRIFADTRHTLQKDGALRKGAYRSYNPSLGELMFLAVIQEANIS
jgi:hypothetical protein